MRLCARVRVVPAESRKGDQTSWSWSYRQLRATQLGCGELNSGPLQEGYLILTTEQSSPVMGLTMTFSHVYIMYSDPIHSHYLLLPSPTPTDTPPLSSWPLLPARPFTSVELCTGKRKCPPAVLREGTHESVLSPSTTGYNFH